MIIIVTSVSFLVLLNRRITRPAELTLEQQNSLNMLDYSEDNKLLDLFAALGTEGYRRFRIKTGWDPSNLGNHTHQEALGICSALFRRGTRKIVVRRELI